MGDHHFQTTDFGKLQYLSGTEITPPKDGIKISRRKYAMTILKNSCFMNAKSDDTPVNPNVKNQEESL
jgi:hypothetical protein